MTGCMPSTVTNPINAIWRALTLTMREIEFFITRDPKPTIRIMTMIARAPFRVVLAC